MATKLVTKSDWAKETLSLGFNIVATAIGFFLALLVNGSIEKSNEQEAVNATKRIILNEARINRTIVDNSFKKYAGDEPGLIYGELTTNVSESMIKDLRFINHTSDELLHNIQHYLRYIRLLNAYKTELTQLRKARYESDDPETNKSVWEASFAEQIVQKRDSLVFYIDAIEKGIRNSGS